MKNQPDISLRIRVASIAIIGLLIVLGAVAYFSGLQVKVDSESIAQDAVPGTIAAHQMRMDMSRSIGWVMVAASAQTTESRDASLKTVHAADVDFANHVAQYKSTIKIDPVKDEALLAEVTSRYATFQQQRLTYEAFILAGDRGQSAAFLENDLVPAYVLAINSAAALLEYNHANSLTYADHIRNSVHQLYWAVAVVMVLGLVCAVVLIVNLSIRRREVMELRESEELFRTSFESATVGVCLVAMDGKFLNVNRTLCATLGYAEAELLQLTFNDVTQDEDRELGRKFLDEARSGGPKTMRTEKRYLRKDGQIVWAYLSTALIERSPGKDAYMISYVQDITERKRAEAALRESELKYRGIVDQSPLGIYQSSLDGRLLSANAALAVMFGYDTPEQILSNAEFMATQRYVQLEQRWEMIHAASEAPASIQREVEYFRRDGTIFPADIYMRAVRAADGSIQYLEGFVEDISIRKRATEQLEMLKVSIDKHFDGAFWLDSSNQIVYVNDSACQALGYAREELLGQPITLIAPQATPDRLQGVWKALRDTGFYTRESRHRRKDGSEFPIELVASYVRFEGKEFNCSFARDITERKRTETALVALQQHQERTLSALGEGVQVIDRKGMIIYENPAAVAMLGWNNHELIGRFGHDLMHHTRADGTPYPLAECKIHATLRDGVARRVEDELFWRKDGTSFPAAYICTAMRNEAGEINELVVAFRDITVQKRAVAELRATNARYTRQETALMALTRACALRQAGSKELMREVVQIAADTLEVERVSIWRYDRDRQGIVCQELFQRSVRIFSDGTKLAAGDFPAYFRALGVGDIIAAHDAHRDPRTLEFSETYLRPLGISSMLDAPIHVMGIVAGVICCEQVGQAREWTADEQTFAIAIANLLSLLLAEEERQQIEGQFRQAQKMEAIGTLAGGIAHDFNNILAAINGYTEMAKRRVTDPVVTRYLDSVYQGGNRAVSLVKQILAFSRPQEAQERKPAELGAIVAEPIKLLRASIPSNIEFDISLDSNLPPVLADATQVHQIVMNLCTNAAHAMKDRAGRLGVRLEKFTVDKLLAGANPGLRVGPYVRLSVSDTGHGMSRATIARIFEPFFTTKGPGEGTGLGLSVVHGIMQSHGGAITVYSQPGEGTVFHLYFPSTTESKQETSAIAEEAPAGHGERILFVDDELPLALLGRNMLEELGYVVEHKTNVAEALALVRANPTAFHLVITDLTMPLMLGTDFARELLLIRPNLPIILTTGYTANLTPERVREMGIRELLLKPHTIQSLGMAVHRALKI